MDPARGDGEARGPNRTAGTATLRSPRSAVHSVQIALVGRRMKASWSGLAVTFAVSRPHPSHGCGSPRGRRRRARRGGLSLAPPEGAGGHDARRAHERGGAVHPAAPGHGVVRAADHRGDHRGDGADGSGREPLTPARRGRHAGGLQRPEGGLGGEPFRVRRRLGKTRAPWSATTANVTFCATARPHRRPPSRRRLQLAGVARRLRGRPRRYAELDLGDAAPGPEGRLLPGHGESWSDRARCGRFVDDWASPTSTRT